MTLLETGAPDLHGICLTAIVEVDGAINSQAPRKMLGTGNQTCFKLIEPEGSFHPSGFVLQKVSGMRALGVLAYSVKSLFRLPGPEPGFGL